MRAKTSNSESDRAHCMYFERYIITHDSHSEDRRTLGERETAQNTHRMHRLAKLNPSLRQDAGRVEVGVGVAHLREENAVHLSPMAEAPFVSHQEWGHPLEPVQHLAYPQSIVMSPRGGRQLPHVSLQ